MSRHRILTRLTQIPGARSLWCRFPTGPVELRVRYGIFNRPHYAYGVYSAADMCFMISSIRYTAGVQLRPAGVTRRCRYSQEVDVGNECSHKNGFTLRSRLTVASDIERIQAI
jgi:hypothetical protein